MSVRTKESSYYGPDASHQYTTYTERRADGTQNGRAVTIHDPKQPVDASSVRPVTVEIPPPEAVRPVRPVTYNDNNEQAYGPNEVVMYSPRRSAMSPLSPTSTSMSSPRSIMSNVSTEDPHGCQVIFYNPLIYKYRKHRPAPYRPNNVNPTVY